MYGTASSDHGRWGSFVVETEPDEALPETARQVGIDPGSGPFAILSDGTRIKAGPRPASGSPTLTRG